MRECNNCDWIGPDDDAVMCGDVGPLCPICRETTTEVTALHVIPVNDIYDHDGKCGSCWCQPTVEENPGCVPIIIHNSADDREAFETDRRKPS